MHRVLIVSGVGGVGKSAVAAAMARALASSGASFGLVDVDTLAQFGPAPWRRRDGVWFYDSLKCQNVAAVWENFRVAGARHLIVAATVGSGALRQHYSEALKGCEVQVALLLAPPDLIRSRLLDRKGDSFHPTTYGPDGAAHEEVLAGVETNQTQLRDRAVEDFTVVNDKLPDEAASRILNLAGWVVV